MGSDNRNRGLKQSKKMNLIQFFDFFYLDRIGLDWIKPGKLLFFYLNDV